MQDDPYRLHTAPREGRCPCGGEFVRRLTAGRELTGCALCRAHFVELDVMKTILVSDDFARSLIDSLREIEGDLRADSPASVSNRCPKCHRALQERPEYLRTREMVLVCSEHGVLFAPGQLQRVLDARRKSVAAFRARVAQRPPLGVLDVMTVVAPIAVVIVLFLWWLISQAGPPHVR